MKHDEMCRGCARERRTIANKTDVRMYPEYETECSQCGKKNPGEYEHLVGGKIYCVECVPS